MRKRQKKSGNLDNWRTKSLRNLWRAKSSCSLSLVWISCDFRQSSKCVSENRKRRPFVLWSICFIVEMRKGANPHLKTRSFLKFERLWFVCFSSLWQLLFVVSWFSLSFSWLFSLLSLSCSFFWLLLLLLLVLVRNRRGISLLCFSVLSQWQLLLLFWLCAVLFADNYFAQWKCVSFTFSWFCCFRSFWRILSSCRVIVAIVISTTSPEMATELPSTTELPPSEEPTEFPTSNEEVTEAPGEEGTESPPEEDEGTEAPAETLSVSLESKVFLWT